MCVCETRVARIQKGIAVAARVTRRGCVWLGVMLVLAVTCMSGSTCGRGEGMVYAYRPAAQAERELLVEAARKWQTGGHLAFEIDGQRIESTMVCGRHEFPVVESDPIARCRGEDVVVRSVVLEGGVSPAQAVGGTGATLHVCWYVVRDGDGECLVDAGMYFARAWQHGYGRAVDDPDSKVHILMEVLADGYSLVPIRVEKVRWVAGNSFSRLGMGVRVEM